jgi:quinol-cytochrome oxidoreductase complex cytochrome b subunit
MAVMGAGTGPVLASIVNLDAPDHYFHWGFILISLANLLVIVAMVVLFVLALLLPFIHSQRKRSRTAGGAGTDGSVAGGGTQRSSGTTAATATGGAAVAGAESTQATSSAPVAPRRRTVANADDSGLWTAKVRSAWLRHLPPEKMLPDSQPAYVASWIYVFGVLTMVALAVVIASGCVLALEGPIWWHESAVGLFVNSLHLWSVECFMGFMVIHLWGKFWMASWRGHRQLTWMTGVVAFLVAVFEAFTGYISQTNFDSQWIAFEAKDAMNAGGIGAFFNTMNFGQALMLHIVFIPLVLVLVVAVHIVMVRLRGVAPPIEALPEHLADTGSDTGAAGSGADLVTEDVTSGVTVGAPTTIATDVTAEAVSSAQQMPIKSTATGDQP